MMTWRMKRQQSGSRAVLRRGVGLVRRLLVVISHGDVAVLGIPVVDEPVGVGVNRKGLPGLGKVLKSGHLQLAGDPVDDTSALVPLSRSDGSKSGWACLACAATAYTSLAICMADERDERGTACVPAIRTSGVASFMRSALTVVAGVVHTPHLFWQLYLRVAFFGRNAYD